MTMLEGMALRRVDARLWRSSQPVARSGDWDALHERGIRCVLKLNEAGGEPDSRFLLAHHRIDASQTVGGELLSLVDEILDSLIRHGVTLVHCSAGVDRTGIVIARYRVRRMGWPRQEAFEAWMASSNRNGNLIKAWEAWQRS
jgi:protein tyrosine/serine phosphatase